MKLETIACIHSSMTAVTTVAVQSIWIEKTIVTVETFVTIETIVTVETIGSCDRRLL